MLDRKILSQLQASPLDELVQALEQLHRTRSERVLPTELRQPASGARGGDSGRLEPLPAAGVAAAPHAASRAAPEAPHDASVRGDASARGDAAHDIDLSTALRSVLAEYEGLLRRYNEDFDRLFARASTGAAEPPAAEREQDDTTLELLQRLRRAQLLLLKYPLAAQAAFAAFAEEGRRYAQTAEGQRWRFALEGSPLLQRVREVVSMLSGGALRENPATLLPSTLVDLLSSVASHSDPQGILARALRPEEGK